MAQGNDILRLFAYVVLPDLLYVFPDYRFQLDDRLGWVQSRSQPLEGVFTSSYCDCFLFLLLAWRHLGVYRRDQCRK